VLLAGMQEESKLGVNPYRLGVIASTDTHNGTPGKVEEASYSGHFGSLEREPEARLTAAVPAGPRNSGGGLVAVWSEENSREAIFDALRRREVYGTSGPRIAVRMFAGWDFPEDLCARADLVDVADPRGVPMGGVLGERPEGAAPQIVVAAQRDVGTPEQPGTGLARLQIVKGWLDAAGDGHIAVFDVASAEAPGSVDEATCEPHGAGADALCSLWTDPRYDPALPSFYYARVVENPVCRWSWRDCLALPASERPPACSDDTLPRTIAERAWTSPIWVDPG
jgi:hypothetical protein